jgi:signal transduction histidine kinase/HAMP domain-containing protein
MIGQGEGNPTGPDAMTAFHIRGGIGAKILLGFVAMAAMIAALGGYGIYMFTAAAGIVADTYDHPLATINYARAADEDFIEMQEELFRRFTVSPAAQAEIDQGMPPLTKSFFANLETAREHALSDSERAAIDAIHRQAAVWMEKWNTIGRPNYDQLEGLSREIDQAFDHLNELTRDNAAVARRDGIAAIHRFEYSSAAAAGLALLLAAAITLLLARRIVRPLSLAATVAERIANGELDTVIPRGGRDQTGILLNAMSAMRDNIRLMMGREREQRRSAQTRLADALESSHEGMVLVDADGRVVAANSQMAMFFPALAAVIRPGEDFATVAPAMRGHLLRPDAAPDLAEIPANGAELQLTDARWIRVGRSSTRDGGGFFIFSDFTEVKEREQRYREAQHEAEAASRAKSAFLANMSHELRTPLNAIIGFSEIMTRETLGPVGNPHYASYLDDILHSGRHLLSVINGVLDLAKSESGKMQLYRESVDLAAILAECASMMRDQCARGGIALDLADDDTVPTISGDPAKLRQVFLNLLSNAVKFTNRGGAVALRLERRGDAALVEVRDTGIGIAAADIPLALSPFGQIDSKLARRYEGTGLGLPLAKELVERHGGTLSIESEPGRGTVVRVALPIAAAEEIAAPNALAA